MAELANIELTPKITARNGKIIYARANSAPIRLVVPIRPTVKSREKVIERARDFIARHVIFLSRLSLAIVFFWFGVMKVAGVSPVGSLLRNSIPFLAQTPYLEILGIVEIVIGMGLLVNRLSKQATLLMILHLLGTLSLFVIAPRLMFGAAFPALTMEGEFVLKNIVLITSALAIMVARSRDDISFRRS